MPSVTTGAYMANRELIYIGVSGDGDTASIGAGQFVHAIRRNLNMVYIVMNNGCYGLTKGQHSATADVGSKTKDGEFNPFQSIDLVGLALELGATFVGRSFSGDKTQLVPLLQAALSHPGFAFLDVLSPCVTFNNKSESTKSYDFIRAHQEATATIDFVPEREEITTAYAEGDARSVTLHDGSRVLLRKLAPHWDPRDRDSARQRLAAAKAEGEILTGLLYIDTDSQDLHALERTVATPLNALTETELCPGSDTLSQINASFR